MQNGRTNCALTTILALKVRGQDKLTSLEARTNELKKLNEMTDLLHSQHQARLIRLSCGMPACWSI